jgi:hypothetical protein
MLMSDVRVASDTAYRRGVILGLTLAEMLILLVFFLTLCAGALLARQAREVTVMTDQINDLEHALGVGNLEPTQLIASLNKRVENAAAAEAMLKTTQADLASSEARAANLQRQVAELSEKLRPTRAPLEERLAVLDRMTAMLRAVPGSSASEPESNLANLITQYEKAVSGTSVKSNGAPGLPSCWTSPQGNPLFMLRITMQGATAGDVTVSADDDVPRQHSDDPAWLLIRDLSRSRFMSISELATRIAALSRRSAELKCRYAVEVVDHTAGANKTGYKAAISRLRGLFYLREIRS